MYVWKCLKVYHLNIFKIIKKEYKKTCEKYQTLSKEGKKSEDMVVNDTKSYQKIKNKRLLSIEKKKIIKWEKTPDYNYKQLFLFRKSTVVLKSNDEAINLLQKADLNKKVYRKGWFKQKSGKL